MKSLVFSVDELYKCSTQSERRNYHLTKELFEEKTNLLMEKITSGLYTFSFKQDKCFFINSQTSKFDFLFQNLVLRKIYRNIKLVYKLTQANRDDIISQIQVLLGEKSPYWILKLDLKSFYESINYSEIIEKIESDCRLNSQTIFYIKKIFEGLPKESKGVPRGISVSAIFSELFMKDFDLKVKRMEGVYYYARFVDDIILFCNSSKSRDNVEQEIEKELERKKMRLNEAKRQKWENKSESELTYLGYDFSHNEKKIVTSIAEKKIKMIKTRIAKSFINYTKNKNFGLLKDRIKFLTGNIVLKKTDLESVYVGIYYNYKKIENEKKEKLDSEGKKKLDELDLFYHKFLNCKTGKIGSVLNSNLTNMQKTILNKYSFKFGFESRVRHTFSYDNMKKIKRCWL